MPNAKLNVKLKYLKRETDTHTDHFILNDLTGINTKPLYVANKILCIRYNIRFNLLSPPLELQSNSKCLMVIDHDERRMKFGTLSLLLK